MNSEDNQQSEASETSRLVEEPSSSQAPSSDYNKTSKTISTREQTITVSPTSSESDEMKRAIAKKLIERYFYQLSDGCGKPNCSNKNCASSGSVEALSPNQAAARAIQLYSQEAELCELHPAKVAKTQDCKANVDDGSGTKTPQSRRGRDFPHSSKSSQDISLAEEQNVNVSSIDEEILNKLLDDCKLTNSYAPLIRRLGNCFSSRESICRSFQKMPTAHIDAMLEKAPKDLKNLKKEDFRTLEGDLDKDEDSSDNSDKPSDPHHSNVDFVSLRRAMARLYEENSGAFETLNQTIQNLATSLCVDLIRYANDYDLIEDIVTVFVILFEIIVIGSSELMEIALPKLLQAATYLPVWAQARLAAIWAKHRASGLQSLLQTLQQLISVHVVAGMGGGCLIQDNDAVVCATKVMKIVYYASMLAGTLDSSKYREDEETESKTTSTFEDESLFSFTKTVLSIDDPLSSAMGINVLDSRKPFVSFEDFYNEPLSEAIEMDTDYLNYKSRKLGTFLSVQVTFRLCRKNGLSPEFRVGIMSWRRHSKRKLTLTCWQQVEDSFVSLEIIISDDSCAVTSTSPRLLVSLEDLASNQILVWKYADDKISIFSFADATKFSYMLYSFILTPATKTLALYYDSRIRMYSERRNNILTTQFAGEPPNPYLNLKVRRDNIIDDALVELELIAMGNPKDLKKQLVVEFIGEQGIDEGGLSKEFFQLVVEQIFNPDYGMFTYQEDTRTVWFNSTSFENEAQFTLIGIVLGLAIYNNIILAVNFPMVVYRKLMGCKGSFADLEDFNPAFSNSLKSMLNYQESDMEEVFTQTFQIMYKDVFGNTMTHDLKPNGSEIFVNQDNKQEFVDLYTDYLLNVSVAKQFKAFKRGFQMVTDESPLHLLFRPEEVEVLVCGSKKFDFDELEKATEYEGGYTKESRIIKQFWEIIHALPMDLKRKLLEFTTGSDRVPVGGLSKLKLVIARNGPDSDRLPTSHTCFNVLLLPEYTDKQKLEDRLMKAISYSKGFGML
ncbi:Ubiquitin-protein ligase E3A [Pseudolycoriella hygida]|uniref:Ubiquitin-protein ligase E3A n=1 Tax=Pseudolycoriella hygida TaxID=35572 RepID=A0A9Q0NEU7_9DIPT|nr:Ubiquitin-protein ligase E3A [Pseudolycoriella hygida]